MPTLQEILSVLVPQGADARFQQLSGGAPYNDFNQRLLEMANQPMPDYAGEIQAVNQQFPDARTGWSENFANSIAGMRMAPPGNFGEGLVQGLAQGFSGATRTRHAEAQDKQERLRSAGSELAKMRWERVKAEKAAAQNDLNQQAIISKSTSSREDVAAANRDAALQRFLAGQQGSFDRLAASIAARDQRNALQRDRFDVGNLFKVNQAIQMDPDVKKFRDVRAAYADGITAAAAGNSSGDIVLMRMLAKATDPTTGVREEEYRTFEGAQGALSQLQTLGPKLVGRGQLTPYGRKELLRRLEERYRNSRSASDARMGHFRKVAESVGVPWDLVDQDFGLDPNQANKSVNPKALDVIGKFDSSRGRK